MVWEQYGGDSMLTREGTRPGFREQPFEQWRSNVTRINENAHFSMMPGPTTDGVNVFYAGENRLYGFDATSGEVLIDEELSFFIGDAISNTVIAGDSVFVYTSDKNRDEGVIYKFDKSTGNRKETTRLDFSPFSNLVLYDDSLYVGGSYSTAFAGESGGHLAKFDLNLSREWETETPDPVAYVAADGSSVYTAGVVWGEIYSFIGSYSSWNGAESEYFDELRGAFPSLVISSEYVTLVAHDPTESDPNEYESGIHAFRRKSDGLELLWDWSPGELTIGAAIRDDKLYALFESTIYSLEFEERKHGRTYWWRSYTGNENGFKYGPTIFGDSIFAASETGIFQFEIDDGERGWRLPVSGSVGSDMVCNSGSMYVITESGDLVCFGLEAPDPIEDYVPSGEQGIFYAQVQYIVPHIEDADEDELSGSARLDVGTGSGNLYSDEYQRQFYPNESKIYVLADRSVELSESLSNEQVEWDLHITDCHPQGKFRVSFGVTLESDHIHSPMPGIIEWFSDGNEDFEQYIPMKADVRINGKNVGTLHLTRHSESNLLVSDYTEKMEIYGELENGSVNKIEVEVEELGHMQVWIEGDVYRRIMGGG